MKQIEKLAQFIFYFFFGSLIFSNTLAQALGIVLIILWIVKWIVTRKFERTPLDLAVSIFLFIRVVSCFISVDRAASFGELHSRIFFSLIYFAFTNLIEKNNKKHLIYRYISIVIYAGVVSSVYGTVFSLLHHFAVKAQSTAGGVTRFAEYTMIAFCFAFTLSHKRNIFPSRFLAFLSVGLLGIGLVFAQERAQWLGIVPVIFVHGLTKKRLLLGYVIVVFAGFILMLRTLRERAGSLLHPLHSSSGRLTIWRGAGMLLLKKPILGFGPGTYSNISPFLKNRGSWHSDYLQIYLESGILGFLSYAFLSFMIFARCIKICKAERTKDIGFSILFVVVAMYIVSFFSGHIQEPVINPLFFSLIAFVSVLSKEES